ncbi:unnamed protein product [Sympodiomycopsis kandeliae]
MPNFQPPGGPLVHPGNSSSSLFLHHGANLANHQAQTYPKAAPVYQRAVNSYLSLPDGHRPAAASLPLHQNTHPAVTSFPTSGPGNARLTEPSHPGPSTNNSNYSAFGYGSSTSATSAWRNDGHSASMQTEVARNVQQYPPSWYNAPKEDHPSSYAQHTSPALSTSVQSWSNDVLPSPLQRPSTSDQRPTSHHTFAESSDTMYNNRMSSTAAVAIPDLQSASPWSSTSVPLRDTFAGGSRQHMLSGAPPVVAYQNPTYFEYQSANVSHLPNYVQSSTGPSTSYHSPSTVLSTPSSDGQGINHGAGGYNQWSIDLMSPPSLPQPTSASRSAYQDDESRWQGVATRSHHADKFYLYGALTTHIYCRPSCASKRPSRDRVQFFPYPNAAASAEAAGFRSCKRCKPDRSGSDQTVLAVGDCVRHMMMAAASSAKEGGEPKKRTLKEYAARAGLSTFHFHRSLAKVMSITPGEYAKASQSMALQDALGIDNSAAGYGRISAKTYEDALAGWSARRAKRALGNVDPLSYSSGDLRIPVVRTSVSDTSYGPVSLVYTAAEDGSGSLSRRSDQPRDSASRYDRMVFAVLIGRDADQRLARRFPMAAVGGRSAQEEVALIVEDLRRNALREEQLPPETVPSIRRARLWATMRKRLASHSSDSGGLAYGSEDEKAYQ